MSRIYGRVMRSAYSLWKDIGERAVATFIQAFIAVEGFDTFFVGALSGRLDLAWFNSAKIAGLAAVAAVVKGYISSKFGSGSAAAIEPVTVVEKVKEGD